MIAAIHPAISATLLMGCFSALMGVLLIFQRRCAPHPETVRKLLHTGMGCAAIFLPWMFTSVWPVVGLTFFFVVLFLGLRGAPALRAKLGGPIHNVDRSSYGEICFALGVGLLFLISKGDPLRFSIPMLLLTFADAAAGLVGTRFGRWRYPEIFAGKSVEGSLTFFVVACFCTHIPLLMFSNLSKENSLLAALAISSTVTLVEAVGGFGLDNLLIPPTAFLCLDVDLQLSLHGLAVHLAVAALLILMALFALRRKYAGRQEFEMFDLRSQLMAPKT